MSDKLGKAIKLVKKFNEYRKCLFGEGDEISESIDTVVTELEKPLPTDDCTHPFNEVDRCEGIIYFCNVCKKYVYKEETE